MNDADVTWSKCLYLNRKINLIVSNCLYINKYDLYCVHTIWYLSIHPNLTKANWNKWLICNWVVFFFPLFIYFVVASSPPTTPAPPPTTTPERPFLEIQPKNIFDTPIFRQRDNNTIQFTDKGNFMWLTVITLANYIQYSVMYTTIFTLEHECT